MNEYLLRVNSKMSKIIVFRGKAGVGKSLLSSELARRLNIPVIRKDDVFDTIYKYVSDNTIRNSICYDLITKIIDTNLESKTDIIIDCPFHFNKQLTELWQRIEEKLGQFKPILCICSDEHVWANRFNQRKKNPSPNNLITDFEEMKKHYITRGIETIPLNGELVLDSIHEIEYLMDQTIKYIDGV